MTAAGRHGGATGPTEMGRDPEGNDPAETASADGIVSVRLGQSEFGAELESAGGGPPSSRGHLVLKAVCTHDRRTNKLMRPRKG